MEVRYLRNNTNHTSGHNAGHRDIIGLICSGKLWNFSQLKTISSESNSSSALLQPTIPNYHRSPFCVSPTELRGLSVAKVMNS